MNEDIIRAVAARVPGVVQYLTGRAWWIATTSESDAKNVDYYRYNLERLIRNLYANRIGGEFIDIMADLISGQLRQAFQQAWQDEGTDDAYPDYLRVAVDEMIANEYIHVDQFFRDIIDARLDGLSIDALLARAALWANRWNDAYSEAVRLIGLRLGKNLMWHYGETEEHCDTCLRLNGTVAKASEWDALGVHPGQPENPLLECGGWRCQCSLRPTEQRRSPKAFAYTMDVVNK